MRAILALMLAMLATAVSVPAQGIGVDLGSYNVVYDANGEVIYEQYADPANPLLLVTKHYLRLGVNPDESPAKPGGGGGGDPGTDCESDAYVLAGWFWTRPYSAVSASHASIVNSALGEWDQATGASIAGSVGSGKQGTAGVYDGVNQLEWVSLGASTTIAVTTTWSYRLSGEAVESDGQYNTYYAWSTSGASNAMDVENIVQHEVGHTLGLDHPKGTGTGCLTMYAYANHGETAKRTLGDGDILGMKAIYGA